MGYDRTSMTGYLYAVPDVDDRRGYRLYVCGNPGMEGVDHGWLLLAEGELHLSVPEGMEIEKGLTGLMYKKIEDIKNKAYKEELAVNAIIHQLTGIAHMPVEKEQHEPEAEEAEVVVDEPKRENWYFTFGGGHAHPNGYVQVRDATYAEAREAMEFHHGNRWAFQYDWQHFEGQPERYNLECVLRLTRDGDFDDDVPF